MLARQASRFPNPQHQLHYTFILLVGQSFTQVKVNIMNNGINLTHVLALIMLLETAFGEPVCITIVEMKLEALKKPNCNFSTYMQNSNVRL
jgi:hypothetical protein